MAKIIFNADDLGWSVGVNKGIVEAYQNGVVNSATLIVTGKAFEQAVTLIKTHRLANIGLHFNLTEGVAILKSHRTLTDAQGNFHRAIHQRDALDQEEVFAELEAQYQKAQDAGVNITHIDSHHHIHMTRAFRKTFARFSRKYKLPIRKVHFTSRNPIKRLALLRDMWGVRYYTPYFCADFYDSTATQEDLMEILKRYQGKNVEIMCHPGYRDPENGEYDQERERELKVLTNPEVFDTVSSA